MVQGYDLRTRIEDARTAYMTSLIVNVQLDKKNQIKVKDIMKDLPAFEHRKITILRPGVFTKM